MTARVRAARPGDAAHLRSLALAGPGGYVFAPDLAHWRWDVLDRPRSRTLVVEDDGGGGILAFATLLPDGTIASCGMDPALSLRRARAAVALLMQVVEAALRRRGAGCVRVRLDEAHPMAALLGSLGYASRLVNGPQWLAVGDRSRVDATRADPCTAGWSMTIADYR